MSFCRVRKDEVWSLKCLLGPDGQKGDLKRCRAIETMRHQLALVEDTSAVADTPPSADDEFDPMCALDDTDVVHTPQKHKTRVRGKCMARDQILTITMPTHPSPRFDSAVAESCAIEVINRGHIALWMNVDHVPWLINYMREELMSGGVPRLPCSAVADTNCDTPGLHIRWNYTHNSWDATFVSGELQGTTLTSKVDNMTADKWVAIAPVMGIEFADASFEQRKEGTFMFWKTHCSKQLADKSAAADI